MKHEIVELTALSCASAAPRARRRGAARALGAELERREVLAQDGRRARVALDEHGARGAARERLDAERAGAGEQVEHARARRARRASRTAPRARGRRSGACPRPGGAFSRRPPSVPAITRIADRSALSRAARRRCGRRAQPGIGGVPRRRRSGASSSAASSACSGSRELRVGGDDRLGTGPRPLQQLRRPRAAARPGTGAGPTGGCRPARPRCAARGRSRRAGSRRRARRARAAAPPPAGRRGSRRSACSPRPTRPRSWCSWEIPKRSAFSISITVALGTSMPDLDHGRRDEHVAAPGGERRHRLLLLARAHARRAAARARSPRSSPVAQPLELGGGRAQHRAPSAPAAAWRRRRRPPGPPRSAGRRRTPGARAQLLAQLLVGRARSRLAADDAACSIGRRPLGSSRSVLVSRSP